MIQSKKLLWRLLLQNSKQGYSKKGIVFPLNQKDSVRGEKTLKVLIKSSNSKNIESQQLAIPLATAILAYSILF